MGVLQGLAAVNGVLHAMWKGEPGDDRLWLSSWNGTGGWTPQAVFPGFSSTGPALANFAGVLYAAWKGEDSDPRIFFATYNGTWGPQTQLPDAFSDTGPAMAQIGSSLLMAWKSPFDQSLHYIVYNGDYWFGRAEIPNVASSMGPSLATYGDKVYAAWKGEGNDPGIYYNTFSSAGWSAQAQIPNVGTSVGPSLAAIGGDLYAVWKGEDGDEGLYFSIFNGTLWSPQVQIPVGGSSVGAAIANYNGILYAMWKGEGNDWRLWDSHFDGNTWAPQGTHIGGGTGPDPVVAPVPVPADGLGSFSNYILANSSGRNLTNVSVSVLIAQDVISSNGFAFQLNCYCPNPQNDDCAWQQYCIVVSDSQIQGTINNWPVNFDVDGNLVDLILEWFPLTSLPSTDLPAGWVLTVTLDNDANDNITGANFLVVDPNGIVKANVTQTLLDFNYPGFTASDLKPINGFELDLVGPYGGQNAVLTFGQGVFIYSANQPLTPLNQEPAGDLPVNTKESANSFYGPMLPTEKVGTSFQLFNTSTITPQILSSGGTHELKRPPSVTHSSGHTLEG